MNQFSWTHTFDMHHIIVKSPETTLFVEKFV